MKSKKGQLKEENVSIEEKEILESLETYGKFYMISFIYYLIYIDGSLNFFQYIFELMLPY